MSDIYFEYGYCKINEHIEGGQAETYSYSSDAGSISYNFIKREIEHNIEGNKTYYDIVSPYGYGGPIITNVKDFNKLIDGYKNDFADFCKKKNIVSEVIRFHPIEKNYKDFEAIYDLEFSRYTVGTNLEDYEDPFTEEFSKSCRKKIRKLLKEGLTYKIEVNPTNISKFKEFYFDTMDRNNAKSFYYFGQEYFDSFLDYYKDNIVLVEAIYENKTIAMGFYFIYGEYIHIHLSGTLNEYLSKSPAYILRYAITQWGKENNYKTIHHGGGRTPDLEDGLYKFKKQFGKNTDYEFYIGKKIWDKEIYDKLCIINNINSNNDYFPAYRVKN